MYRPDRMTRTAARLAAVVAGLALWGQPAAAQTKTFRIAGIGVGQDGLPPPGAPARPHVAVGAATDLGLYYGAGSVQTDAENFRPDPTVGPLGGFKGTFGSGPGGFTFYGAGGDVLATDYGRTAKGAKTPGTVTLTIVGLDGMLPVVTAEFVAEFVVDGARSAGRFRGASGSWVMLARTAPFTLGSDDPVLYTWEGEGRVTFRRR